MYYLSLFACKLTEMVDGLVFGEDGDEWNGETQANIESEIEEHDHEHDH